MGKASKFFRALLGFKTSDPTAQPPTTKQPAKRRWSFGKSNRDKPRHHLHNASNSVDDGTLSRPLDNLHRNSSDGLGDGNDNPSKHAMAVAAATAAVADAAVEAAQAAAVVVRLTNRTTVPGAGYCAREELAAVKIQSYFRAYLARRALRALKGLVKLQALVRGHILRKQTADMMRRLQALIRAQARARAGRAQIADSPPSGAKGSSHFHHHGPPTPEKFEHVTRAKTMKYEQPSTLKRNGSRGYAQGSTGQGRLFPDGLIDDEKSDKIVEIDTGKPHITPRRRNLFQQDQISHSNSYSYSQSFTTSRGSTIQQTGPSPSASCEVNSLTAPLRCCTHDNIDEEASFCTAETSPPFYSAASKGNSSMISGPFTPAKSDSSRSCLSGYSDHPNYMAYTESSRAKVRSLSAPKQRPQLEVSSMTKRYSVYGYGSGMQRVSTLRDSFASKAYPGSGRLDRLGMPVGGFGEGELGGSCYLNRY